MDGEVCLLVVVDEEEGEEAAVDCWEEDGREEPGC